MKYSLFFLDFSRRHTIMSLHVNHIWISLESDIDKLFCGRMNIIKEQYQDLNEMEFKICILSHFDLSKKQETDFMHCSVCNMDKYRSKLCDKMTKTNNNTM